MNFKIGYMFRRPVAIIREYHIQRSISTHTSVWVLMLLLYFGLPEGGASAPKHVADFKIYIQFLIILCELLMNVIVFCSVA